MSVAFIFPTVLSAVTIPVAEGTLWNHRFLSRILQWALVREVVFVPTEETGLLSCIGSNAWSKSPWMWTQAVYLSKRGLMFDGILIEHQA